MLIYYSNMKSAFQNWADVRVFLAVMRTGSTLAAAKVLDMSQPTVARRIDALEHSFKLTLFERDTRGFRPTQDAKHLLPHAEAVERAMERLVDEADNAKLPNARAIRITAPRANFSTNFSRIISEYSDLHAETHFEFIATNDVMDLGAGEADIAIRIAKKIDDDRLICRKLNEVTASLYASPEYARRYGIPTSPAEFPGHKFVVYERYASSVGVNEWLIDQIDRSQIESRCADVEAMIAAIKVGMGIGVVATSMASDHPELIRCFPPPPGYYTNSWLLINPDAYRRPEVKSFVAFFAPRYQAIFKRPAEG